MLQIFKLRIHQAEGGWEWHHTEGRAKEDDGVADVVEVEVLYRLGAQNDKEDHKYSAVEAVIEVGQGRGLNLDEADGGQGRREDHEQGHGGGDRGMLHPEDVSPEQALQLAILEPVPIE